MIALRSIATPRVRALGVAVVGLAALRVLLALPGLASGDGGSTPRPLIHFVPGAVVARVELSRGERRIALESVAGGGWVVTRAGDPPLPARPGVEGLIERIAGWTTGRLAATEAARHDALGVSEARARRVRLEGPGGEPSVEVLVGGVAGAEAQGSNDPTRLGTLVRVAGHDVVYVVPDLVAGEVEPDPRAWYARPGPERVVEDARRISLRRGDAPGATVHLAPGQPPRLEGGAAVDVEAVVTLLAWLAALDVVAPAPEAAPPADALALEVEVAGAPTWSARLWSAREVEGAVDATWWLARTGQPTVEVGAAAASHIDEVARRGVARVEGGGQ